AKFQSCVRYDHAPAANMPGSFESRVVSWPGRLGSVAWCRPAHRPLVFERSAQPDHCKSRQTTLSFPRPAGVLPSPIEWLRPGPTARNKSRWSHRPGSRSGRTNDRPGTTDDDCRQCAASCPVVVYAAGVSDAFAAIESFSPILLLATHSSPSCSSSEYRVLQPIFRGNGSRSGRSTHLDKDSAPVPLL